MRGPQASGDDIGHLPRLGQNSYLDADKLLTGKAAAYLGSANLVSEVCTISSLWSTLAEDSWIRGFVNVLSSFSLPSKQIALSTEAVNAGGTFLAAENSAAQGTYAVVNSAFTSMKHKEISRTRWHHDPFFPLQISFPNSSKIVDFEWSSFIECLAPS